MTRRARLAHTAALVLVCGGLIALGAFAGVWVAFGVTTRTLACGPLAESGCHALLARLTALAQTFAVGGSVALICGGVALWALGHVSAPDATAESEA